MPTDKQRFVSVWGAIKDTPNPALTLRDDVLPALGLGVNQAAEQLGVSRSALSRVLNGRAAISENMARRIQERLGVYRGADGESSYTLKAIRELIPMAREELSLLASFDPFGDGKEPWIIRYIVDKHGFWLQVNDKYGRGASPLSFREFISVTGFDADDLEPEFIEGLGWRYGLPGGRPILPLSCTARQFQEFDNLRLGGCVRDSFLRQARANRAHVMELKHRNPDAAELAQFLVLGVESPPDTPPAQSALLTAHETKEQRQDRRCQACEVAGLSFNDYKGRLPDGVGKVAALEGVTRQAFSTDVKAALDRRESAKSAGKAVHRA